MRKRRIPLRRRGTRPSTTASTFTRPRRYEHRTAAGELYRKFSGSRRAIIHQRRCQVNSCAGELRLRLILDRFSAEVFINDGEQVMSATFYTDRNAQGISFFCDGAMRMDVIKYDMEA